jgi:hypothetical protein
MDATVTGISAIGPKAADQECPLYVRFGDAERTRFAGSEFFRV